MASRLKSALEGWENWQIALAVGAPIALGLAGLWYYKRSNTNQTGKKSNKLDDDIKAGPKKSDAQLNLEKAQEAKTKGNKYFKGGSYDLAIECYTEAIRICPENQPSDLATFHQNRAAAYEQLKNSEKVIEDCNRALELHSRYVKAFFRRAKAYEKTNQLTSALEDITAVCIMENFENPTSFSMADRVLKELGKTKAEEAFKNRQPAMPSKQNVRSYFAGFANDPVYKWQKSRSAPKQNVAPVENSENHEKVENGETDEVEKSEDVTEDSEKVKGQSEASNSPDQAEAYEPSAFEKARDALLTGDYDSIIDLCTSGIETPNNPDNELCILLRGTFYYIKGQGQLALKDWNSLLNTENLAKNIKVNALIKRASLSLDKGTQTEALDDLAAAVRLDSTNSDVYYHRGQHNLSLDRIDDAQRDFEKCIQLNPTFSCAYVQKSYAEYRGAVMHQSPLQMQSAMKSFKETVEKFPANPDGHLLYGQALCDQRLFDEADQQFRAVLEAQPDNAQSLVHRGLLCLQWKQDINSALSSINQALVLDDKCSLAYETLATLEVQKGNMARALELFNKAIPLCTSEAQMNQMYCLLLAATAQTKVAERLGLKLPMTMSS